MLGLAPGRIGLSRSRVAQTVPLSLSPLIWSDVSDSATVFQNAAGSTAAAVSDPVARINDKSGNVTHFYQDDNADKRPLLASDGVAFDNANDQLRAIVGGTISSVSSFTVPDLSDSIAGKGFTCTGLSLDTSNDTLWLGNDGRSNAAGSSHRPGLINVSKAGALLTELDLSATFPSATTIQDVAYDATDDTLWFCSTGENLVRRISRAGASISSFTRAGAQGIAINPSDGTLFVGSGTTVYIYSKTGTLQATFRIGHEAQGLHYDTASQFLYFTCNGSLSGSYIGAVYVPTREVIGRHFVTDTHVTGEGILLDGSTLYVASPSYFHSNTVNKVMSFAAPSFARNEASKITVFGVMRIPATTTIKCFMSVQDSFDQAGIGLFIPSSSATAFRVFINSSAGTAQRDTVDITGLPNLTTKRAFLVEVDTDAKTLKLWVDGTQYGGTRALTNTAGGISLGTVSLGINGPGGTYFSNAVIKEAGVISRILTDDERTALNAYLVTKAA